MVIDTRGKLATYTHPRSGDKIQVVVFSVRKRDGFLLCGYMSDSCATFSVSPATIQYK